MFDTIKKQIESRWQDMLAIGTVFNTSYDRDEIWQAYLSNFDESCRQESNCSCCRAFIRQIGGAVVINPDNTIGTLWDIADVPEQYRKSIEGLRDYVRSRPLCGLYYHQPAVVGTDKSPDPVKNVVWTHYCVTVPKEMVKIGAAESGNFFSEAGVFKRALSEIPVSVTETVLELDSQGSLYRGSEARGALEALRLAQKEYAEVPEDLRTNFAFRKAKEVGSALARVRNSAIGTLLQNLSEGMDLERAVTAYEHVMAPINYKRPKALVTPRMVEDAKKTLSDLGFLGALDRRRLDARDLSAAHALYTFRSTQKKSGDVFDSIIKDTPVNPQTLSKVDEIGINDFLTKVLPGATGLRVLFERRQFGNLVTLTGPQDADAKSMMKWDNSYGWSYTGGVADSIKEKVKAAGGKVEGVWFRASLAWHNYDDLDLHLMGKDVHVFFGNKRNDTIGAHLDVDMNAHAGRTREPVENIYARRQLPPGDYKVLVHQFCKRETRDGGCELEIEINGKLYEFSWPTNPDRDVNTPTIDIKVAEDGTVAIDGNGASHRAGGTKWGLKAGVWQQVIAVTLSPNHWTKPVGNKHFMFLLRGCVSDEKTVPFLNEFLCEALDKNRKVTEVLANKIEVLPADGVELSGLGFSETVRNHLYVEVEGNFKRTLKVLI